MPATRILVVDDAPHLAQYLQHTLRRAGYDALICSKIALVNATLSEFAPAAVLLNVELQQGSGLDVCKSIRNASEFALVAVLLVTGRIFGRGAPELTAAGAHAILLKPVSPGALIGRLLDLGIGHDDTDPNVRSHGSGTMVPLAQSEQLKPVERIKIELAVTLAPLANALRVGAYLHSGTQSGWLAKPDDATWSAPVEKGNRESGVGSRVQFRQRVENIAINGVELGTVTLVTDADTDSGLKACA